MTSSDHNLRHMEFLELVAASDVAVLRKKEATYQGSWKAAGGRSAWFMARRNIDRLLNMMAPPPWPESFSIEDIDDAAEAPDGESSLTPELAGWIARMLRAEDIFLKVEEKPLGSDGTVLAVCRDLRRYLMLVEAEMISRGVVSAEQGEVRSGQGTTRFGEVVEVNVTQFVPPNTPLGSEPTMAERMSEALGRTSVLLGSDGNPILPGTIAVLHGSEGPIVVHEVNHEDRTARIGGDIWVSPSLLRWVRNEDCAETKPQPKLYTSDGELIYLNHFYRYQHRIDGPVVSARVTALDGDLLRIDVGRGVILRDISPRQLLRLSAPEMPTKNWQSAAAPLALQPWLVDTHWIHARVNDKEAVDTYYKRQALSLWVLEPAVRGVTPPSPVAHLYTHQEGWYILGIHHCPFEARDYFPRLESEVNTVTRDQLPEWQRPMYYWSESETKWRISPTFEAWTVRD